MTNEAARALAIDLSVSVEAVELCRSLDFIDQHLDSLIWSRIFGYRLDLEHARPPLFGWFLGHADFPRIRRVGMSGGVWVVSTNPLRAGSERFETLLLNLADSKALFARHSSDFVHARSLSDYRSARAQGKHAAFLGIQGGNALDGTADSIERLPALDVLRVTLVHLSNSAIGSSSAPSGSWAPHGLTAFGRRFVERLNAARIFVDLAHISEAGFWDALDVHDPHLPAIVTHTGVSGVHRHWRNLNDSQLRAIAHTGGLVGIMLHAGYLGPGLFRTRIQHVLAHIEHALRVAGEDSVGIGSDFDGFIVPPRDLPSVLHYPRLVQAMLDRNYPLTRIQKILGGNFLRVLGQVRP